MSATAQAVMETTPSKMGRPTTYTPEKGFLICEKLSEGLSLNKIARLIDEPVRVIYQWLDANEDFAQQYARARRDQAHALADEILSIADDSHNDYVEDEDGNPRFNKEAVMRARLRVDSRKWIASKMLPKVYGEKLDLSGNVELTASNLDPKAVIDNLVSLATEHPIVARPLRQLLERALAALPNDDGTPRLIEAKP